MACSADLRGGISCAFVFFRYIVDIAAGTPLHGCLTGAAEARDGAWERAFSHGHNWNIVCRELVVKLAPKFASGGEERNVVCCAEVRTLQAIRYLVFKRGLEGHKGYGGAICRVSM